MKIKPKTFQARIVLHSNSEGLAFDEAQRVVESGNYAVEFIMPVDLIPVVVIREGEEA